MRLLLESGDFLMTEDDRHILTEDPAEDSTPGGVRVWVARRSPVTVSVQ